MPEELRAGYLLLEGAGILPEELQARQELVRLEDLIAACHDDGVRLELVRAHTTAALRYALLAERRGLGPAHQEYAARLAAKLGARASVRPGG